MYTLTHTMAHLNQFYVVKLSCTYEKFSSAYNNIIILRGYQAGDWCQFHWYNSFDNSMFAVMFSVAAPIVLMTNLLPTKDGIIYQEAANSQPGHTRD